MTANLPTAFAPEAASAATDTTAKPSTSGRDRRISSYLLIAAIVLGFALVMIRPGLAQWVNDEPKLVGDALLANRWHTLAVVGLRGSLHIEYGPQMVWICQAMLLVSHRIETIISIHAALYFTATIASYFWLGRELQLRPRFLVLLAFSPGIFYFSRLIWDNPLNVPLSAVILASFARMLRKPDAPTAALLTAASVCGILIHPMILPLVVAVGVAAACWGRGRLLKYFLTVSLTGIICLLPFYRYFNFEYAVLMDQRPDLSHIGVGITDDNPFAKHPMPVLKKLKLCWGGIGQIIIEDAAFPRFKTGLLGGFQRIAVNVSRLLYAVFALGAVLAIANRHGLSRFIVGLRSLTPHQSVVAQVALAALLLQSIYFLTLQFELGRHHVNGLFAVYALFAWIGIDSLPRTAGNVVFAALAVALLLSTVLSLINLQQENGNQSGYGPTVGEQQRLLAELDRQNVSKFGTDVRSISYFQHALRVLAALDGLDFSRARFQSHPQQHAAFVRYNKPEDGHLDVINLPPSVHGPGLRRAGVQWHGVQLRGATFDLSIPIRWEW